MTGVALTQCLPRPRKASSSEESPVIKLVTTPGTKGADAVEMILPHEHIFVDLLT